MLRIKQTTTSKAVEKLKAYWNQGFVLGGWDG